VKPRRTHCTKGHPLINSNISKAHLKQGARICRRCWNAYMLKRDRAKAAEKKENKL
jgi:hypothetical protein